MKTVVKVGQSKIDNLLFVIRTYGTPSHIVEKLQLPIRITSREGSEEMVNHRIFFNEFLPMVICVNTENPLSTSGDVDAVLHVLSFTVMVLTRRGRDWN